MTTIERKDQECSYAKTELKSARDEKLTSQRIGSLGETDRKLTIWKFLAVICKDF